MKWLPDDEAIAAARERIRQVELQRQAAAEQAAREQAEERARQAAEQQQAERANTARRREQATRNGEIARAYLAKARQHGVLKRRFKVRTNFAYATWLELVDGDAGSFHWHWEGWPVPQRPQGDWRRNQSRLDVAYGRGEPRREIRYEGGGEFAPDELDFVDPEQLERLFARALLHDR